MSRRLLPCGLVLAVLTCVIGVGCNKKAPTPSGNVAAGPTIPPNVGGSVASNPGRAIFDAQRCANCHSMGGGPETVAREGKKNKGPDLAKVGADPAHTKDWLAAYIRDPKSQNPASHMPPFGSKISDDDLGKLADYLASLK
jgi:mono/diheme cytochrome c family protein